jgi:hypothetical protein
VVVTALTCTPLGSVKNSVSLADASSQSREMLMVPGATTAIVCVRNLVPVTDTELVKVLLDVAVSALGDAISPSIAMARTVIGQRANLRREVFSVDVERSQSR